MLASREESRFRDGENAVWHRFRTWAVDGNPPLQPPEPSPTPGSTLFTNQTPRHWSPSTLLVNALSPPPVPLNPDCSNERNGDYGHRPLRAILPLYLCAFNDGERYYGPPDQARNLLWGKRPYGRGPGWSVDQPDTPDTGHQAPYSYMHYLLLPFPSTRTTKRK